MSTPVLHHCLILNSTDLPVKSGAKITVSAEASWDGPDSTNAPISRSVIVEGSLECRGRQWTEKWRFNLPPTGYADIESGLKPILGHLDGIGHGTRSRQPPPHDVSVEIYDWLRAGWSESGGTGWGYMVFRKDGFTMTSNFEDAETFFEIRNVLRRYWAS
jgi:hypothetical protein